MDKHTEHVIFKIKSENNKINLRLFDDPDFYSKHFGAIDLSVDKLSGKLLSKFNKSMRDALNEQINDIHTYNWFYVMLFVMVSLYLGLVSLPFLFEWSSQAGRGYTWNFTRLMLLGSTSFLVFLYVWLTSKFQTFSDGNIIRDYIFNNLIDGHTKMYIERLKKIAGMILHYRLIDYDLFFGDVDLTSEYLSSETASIFNSRIIAATEYLMESLKRRSNALFIALPFTWIGGGIIKDLLVFALESTYPNFPNFEGIVSFVWILLGILSPIVGGISSRVLSNRVKGFMKLEQIKKNATVIEPIQDANKPNRNSIERLKELDQMLKDKLIDITEYNYKKSEILRDL
jgi:hypothetical protein